MTCMICRNGRLEDGLVTVTLERGSTLLIFKNVPARVCDTCGEEVVSAEVNRLLLERAEEKLQRGIKLELLDYSAVAA